MKKRVFFILLIGILSFGLKEVYASNVVTPSTDIMHVLTTTRGNAILLESEGKYALMDIGDQGSSEVKCMNFYKEIKHVIGEEGTLDYIILSHTHKDHTRCLKTILEGYTDNKGNHSGIPTKNLIMKYYYKSQNKDTTDYDVRDKFLEFRTLAKNAGTTFYAIRSTDKEKIENNHFYLVDANNQEISPNKDMKFLDYEKDWNKSYLNLKVGHYNLYLFNLPQRFTESDNYNSLVVYGEINGYKIYIGGDIENARTTMKDNTTVSAYDDIDLYYYSQDKKRIFGIGSFRLADFYAQYIHNQFSKGKVNVYVAGHHGATNGTTTSIARRLIKKSTKIIYTTSYEYLNSKYSYGEILRNDGRCEDVTGVERHRCQNDKSVNRIIYALSKRQPQETSEVTIFHTSTNKVLRIGFNTVFDSGAKRLGVSGPRTIYQYNSKIKR